MSNSVERYNNTAIALHWLIALLIFVAFPMGLYMSDMKLSPTKLQLISYHKWIGVCVFYGYLLSAGLSLHCGHRQAHT